MSRIELIGVSSQTLDAQQLAILEGCYAVVVSRRHVPLVRSVSSLLLSMTPVTEMLDLVEESLLHGDVAVLASGDPLFFGIGKTLLQRFDPEQVVIRPALSAVQLACARFKVAWDDMALLSLHGRPLGDIPGRVLRHAKVMLFTDTTNSPDQVAAALFDVLTACGDQEKLHGVRVRVAENLGLDDERLFEGSLEDIRTMSFGPLNMMLVEHAVQPGKSRFGLTEHEIDHSRGLITKNEVRAAALHKLCLPQEGVLWDIGGGSGSVSVEAACLNPDLSVFIVEKKPEEQENIRRNIKKFNTYNVHLVCGEAPAGLGGLPNPDRVFIGGSGSQLEEVVEHAQERLAPGGRIVVNAVLARTAATTPLLLHQLGLDVETCRVAVSRQDFPAGEVREFNPITIITGKK